MLAATQSHTTKKLSKKQPSKTSSDGTVRSSALRDLISALSLYLFCVSLPTLLGVAVRFYDEQVASRQIVNGMSVGLEVGYYQDYLPFSFPRLDQKRMGEYVCSSSVMFSGSGWCRGGDGDNTSLPPTVTPTGLAGTGAASKGSASAKTGASAGAKLPRRRRLSDLQIILVLSIALAMLRIFLVHMLVPRYLAPRRLAALVRCKSTHLLSTGTYGLSSGSLARLGGGGSFGSLASLSSIDNNSEGGEDKNSKGGGGGSFGHFGQDDSSEGDGPVMMDDDDDSVVGEGAIQTVESASPLSPPSPGPGVFRRRSSLGSVDGDGEGARRGSGTVLVSGDWKQLPVQEGSTLGKKTVDAWNGYTTQSLISSSCLRSKFRYSLRRALGHEPTAPYEQLDTRNTLRLFSAPRYATAIFRLIYCSASCFVAYVMFRSADFWPVYLGGRAENSGTKNCWDLSGSVAIGSLDFDFDHRNAALRVFFLAQASYQLHSLCFHLVSMALLLVYGGGGSGEGGGNGRLVSMKKSMKCYARPLAEHLTALALILGSYIFSSLRRLGAVGIYTLDFGSIFLHLLQVCLNAPDESPWRRPGVVKFVHRFVVVPTFMYSRLFVLPFIVWYSAAFESQEWLDQIEKAFVPGSARALYLFFNGLILIIFMLNLVFFRRLLFHPHLRNIIYKK